MTVTALLAFVATASAQETLDVGVLRDQEIAVVQKMLYPKEGRGETSFHAGLMPFDAFTTTPVAALSYARHKSETLGFEGTVGGGWGMKNSTMKELEGPAYGVTPDVYRYLGEVTGAVQWAPIYAKFNFRGTHIYHHDMYVLGGGGLTVEQAFMPDKSLAFSPTVAVGIGARLFLPSGNALRLQIKDDVLAEHREKTSDTYIKQNVAVTLGFSVLGKK